MGFKVKFVFGDVMVRGTVYDLEKTWETKFRMSGAGVPN